MLGMVQQMHYTSITSSRARARARLRLHIDQHAVVVQSGQHFHEAEAKWVPTRAAMRRDSLQNKQQQQHHRRIHIIYMHYKY